MAPQLPRYLLLVVFSLSLSTLPTLSTPLSTFSISHTTNRTLICALIPSINGSQSSIVNCTSYGLQDPISNANLSFYAIVGGDRFVCGLISPGRSSNDTIRCWRFSENGTITMSRRGMPYQRVYNGPPIDELESGTSNFCGILSRTRRIACWPPLELSPLGNQNFSSIAVGGDFVCGLTDQGAVRCLRTNSNVLESVPSGNFTVVAAGSRHACAIRLNDTVVCWGERVGIAPEGKFRSLALGDRRSCALDANGSAVCWGDRNFTLPGYLAQAEFVEIQAKGSVFCGILTFNYSLVCWGNLHFEPNQTVFGRVLPGPCTSNECPCGILDGSGTLCINSQICKRCEPETDPPGPLPPTIPGSDGRRNGTNDRRVAFLVVGIVGTTIGVAAVAWFLLFRVCKVRGCRIHDSGRLDDAAQVPSHAPSMRAISRIASMQPQLDKRLSKLISMGAGGNLEEFSLPMLLQITNNFSDDHKIGTGSFGSVYRATLDDDRDVAIKRAELTAPSSYAGWIGTKRQEKQSAFLAELALLSRLNHKNLVRLIGFCDSEHESVLVYDYLPNGTLHDHLHKLESSPLISWTARLKVALDAARGIEYLHTYAVPPIIHRDIKSSNILLDATWTAKVSDFGLSLMGPDDEESHLSLRAAGTVGYMDPEYYRLQQLTTKSDVYSFGVVLLELLTGYKAIHRDGGGPRNVVDFAVPYIVTDEIHQILDRKLPPPTPNEIEAVVYVGYLAADCVSLEGQNRPSMTEIVNYLERALAACLVQPPSISRSTTRSGACSP
ncbi:serine/threonine-protein kinase-like protein CCR4 [Magnolia sinica]|uniref:serine/threonine-protein kinase-like protein CCR4 n=1 Tax=Magnolia sinica TaxID=86752 RepID=UPI00265A5674|nr:serine/threonine-protein kinase-like protein CCR4 [Magnolia sinica]